VCQYVISGAIIIPTGGANNMSAKKHYDSHLGNFYSWMIGDFSARSNEQQSFFTSHDILPHDNRIAVDLGCGNGIQSIALAKLGFEVIAVDFNNQLIEELRNRA
jgi:2-polyprenyl-3-methyl-5-hydroxy-6-metoxy-1,4-benzoquinol methylase